MPQRLHQIDVADVYGEGIGWEDAATRAVWGNRAFDYFVGAGDSIYAESYPSEDDPWIRRIEFKATEGATP